MTNPLYDNKAADRPLDSFDRSQSAAVLIYGVNPAVPGYASALTIEQIGGGGGGGSAPADLPVYIAAADAYLNGFTPAVDGTLLIQSLCRECYFEGYVGEAAPINAEPASQPVLSCGPERWASVPVRGGIQLSFYMNGLNLPPHVDEVSLTFLPGVTLLAGGEMLRHPLPNSNAIPLPVATYPYESLYVDAGQHTLASVPAGATYAEMEVVSGAVNWAMGGVAGSATRKLETGDTLTLRGAEIAAFRATQNGSAAASLHIEYGREA